MPGPLGPISDSPPGWCLRPNVAADIDFVNDRYYGWSKERMVTTRASVGYAQEAAADGGLLRLFAANVPRINGRGLLCEPSATNLCLRSRDFANAAWTLLLGTIAQTSAGADGTTNGAARFTATSANATILQTVTGSSVSRSFSIWIKRITGTGTVGLCQDGTTFTDISAQLNTTGFVLVQLKATQLNPVFGIQLGSNGDAIDVDFAQLETTPYATSPIVTAGSTVARNSDLVVDTAFPAVQLGPKTLYIEATPVTATAQATIGFTALWDGTANNRIYIFRSSGGDLYTSRSSTGGVTADAGSVTGAGLGTFKGAAVNGMGTQQSRLIVNGTLSGGSGSPTSFGAHTAIVFGQDGGNNFWGGYIRRVAVFGTTLPDGDAIKLTS